MIKYRDIHKAQTSAELFDIAEEFAREAGIAVNLYTWPGTWPSIANGLRWESCKDDYTTEQKENMLLLANLLMDGEARHTTLCRLDRARQNDLVDEAWNWLSGWIEATNQELKTNPEYAKNLDSLTTVMLSVTYARAFMYARDDRFQAMRCAILRELELFLFTHDGKPTVATGAQIKAMTNRENHRVAVLDVQGRRI